MVYIALSCGCVCPARSATCPDCSVPTRWFQLDPNRCLSPTCSAETESVWCNACRALLTKTLACKLRAGGEMPTVSSYLAMSAMVPIDLRSVIGQSSTTFASVARAEALRELCDDWRFEVRGNRVWSVLHEFAQSLAGGEIELSGEHSPEKRHFLRQHGHSYSITETGRGKFWRSTRMNSGSADSLLAYITRQGLAGCKVCDIVAESDDALVRCAAEARVLLAADSLQAQLRELQARGVVAVVAEVAFATKII